MDCEPGRSGAWTIVVAITDAHVFIKVFRVCSADIIGLLLHHVGEAEAMPSKGLRKRFHYLLRCRCQPGLRAEVSRRETNQAPRAPFEVADTLLARLPFSPATCSDLTSAIRSTTAAYPFGRSASTATPASEPRMSLMRCKIDTAGESRLRKTRADTMIRILPVSVRVHGLGLTIRHREAGQAEDGCCPRW